MGQAKWEKFTKEELKDKWFNCLTKREFAEQLGYNSSGHIKEIQEKIGLNDKDLGKNNSKQKKYIVGPKGSTIEDLTGKQFGHWKVLSLDINKTENDYHHSWWICQCDCDKQTIRSITMNNLKRGKTQSCGCDLIRAEDIIGEKFGKLKVLSIDKETYNRRGKQVICECDCGNKKSICCTDLKSGHILSCGCLGTSAGEFLLEQLFINNSIQYKKQVSFPDLIGDNNLLRFDFEIVYNNVFYIIEYQGEQHYHSIKAFGGEKAFIKQKRYDDKKRNYCKDNNIKLIEIPYWDKEKINLKYLKEKLNEYCN